MPPIFDLCRVFKPACDARGACTPSCQLRLKARVDLGDQTAEFILFEVISTAILTYFYLLLGTNVRILVSAINTRFQPDAPGWCRSWTVLQWRYFGYFDESIKLLDIT
jgi:hypothetical protein